MLAVSWKPVVRNALLIAALALYLVQCYVNLFEAERTSWQGWAALGTFIVYMLLRRRLMTVHEVARLAAAGAGTPAFGEAADIIHGRRSASPTTPGPSGGVVNELVVERRDLLEELRHPGQAAGEFPDRSVNQS